MVKNTRDKITLGIAWKSTSVTATNMSFFQEEVEGGLPHIYHMFLTYRKLENLTVNLALRLIKCF